MRRFVYISAVLLLSLVACSREDSLVDETSGDEIRFSMVSVSVDGTKSQVSVSATDTTLLKTNGFRVAGIWKGDTEYLKGTVSYDSSGSEYVLDEVKYWPFEGDMTFYSVYPKSIGINTDNPASPFINFTTDGSTDLITARTRVPNRTVANISFNHSLALVTIQCKGQPGAEIAYKVKKIQAITRESAKFDFISWSDYSSSTRTIDIYDGDGVTFDSNADFTAVGGFVTMLPTDLTLKIRYEVYQRGLLIYESEGTAVMPAAMYPVMGYTNTYQCTLSNSASEIYYTVSVNDWSSGSYDVNM